jgi:hypothetical protein
MPSISLDIRGFADHPVPNQFMRHDDATELAILFPGYGYGADLPGLYYPGHIMLGRGADLLRVDYAYNTNPEFAGASNEIRSNWFREDIDAAYGAAIAQGSYQQVVLIGKSLGTNAMSYLLGSREALHAATCIWLTPLLKSEPLVDSIRTVRPRSLFAIGTSDEQFDAAILDELVEITEGTSVVIDGMNHGMEIPGDVPASLRAMEKIVDAIEGFLPPRVSPGK